MRRLSRIIVLACAAAVVAAAPAEAGQVILVKGDHAVRVNDPTVPSKQDIALGPPMGGRAPLGVASARARGSARKRADRRAVYRALLKNRRRGKISRREYKRWRRWYVRSIRTYKRLRGARRTQLGYVIDSLEELAMSRRLGATRMPAAFVQLERNRRYWRSMPYPASGDQVSFSGSELLYQYFPGEGLQLHPLSTFKKANLMYGECKRGEPTCDRDGLRDLLDEMTGFAVQRSRNFIAWEYSFDFGGGSPPWMSGMAQATGIQALGRAAQLLGEPSYIETARKALGAFQTPPPRGVRTTGFEGGVHYLQYSFAPRLYIFNAFLQSLIGLYDFGNIAPDPLATQLYREAKPEADAEIPFSDVGDWSLYSYRGRESTPSYHELLREFLASMCTRRQGPLYCEMAERYRGYQVDPPELVYTGPDTATVDQATSISFDVSKLSAVEVKIYRGSELVFTKLDTFRRGPGSFSFRPDAPGTLRVELAAKELRTGLGKRDSTSANLTVQPAS